MRQVSSDFLQDLFDPETGEAILALVTIEEASLSAPIRVTSDGVETVSNGNTFQPLPFEFVFPDQSDDGEVQAKLTIDNVDRRIVKAVRDARNVPNVTTQIVRGSTPDTIEAEFPDFKLRNANYNQLTVEGTLSLENLVNQPFPAHVFNPSNFPAVF